MTDLFIQWQPAGGGTVRVVADAVEHEDFGAQTDVTQHPVEDGGRVTDHIRNEPKSYKCRMFFSGVPTRGDLDPNHKGTVRAMQLPTITYPNNTPLLTPGGLTKAAEGLVSSAASALGLGDPSGPKSASVLQFDDPPGRMKEFLGLLLEAREAKYLFTVGGSTIQLSSMALTNVTLSRVADDGDSGGVDLEFTEIKFVTTEQAAAVPLPKEPRGQNKKSGKAGATTEVPDNTPKKTAGAALLDTFFGPPKPSAGGGFFQ